MPLPTLRLRPERERLNIPDSPRAIAVEWLRSRLESGTAGLDPYDRILFLLDATPTTISWAYRCLELCGVVLYRAPHGDGQRMKALLFPDVRDELGLRSPDAPTLPDEPLASRRVDSPLEAILDSLFPEPEAPAALARAKAAYDARYPEGA